MIGKRRKKATHTRWKRQKKNTHTHTQEHANYYATQTELDENRVEPLCVHVSFSLFGRAEHFSKFATSHNLCAVSFTLR